ncbi:MAG: hypothetical protein M1833_006416 [Piccolia ochrophora]|nr:MAG: hypothetical protein M1833_006416 [Piccolia ochrophora]
MATQALSIPSEDALNPHEQAARKASRNAQLPRSASYTYIPSQLGTVKEGDTKGHDDSPSGSGDLASEDAEGNSAPPGASALEDSNAILPTNDDAVDGQSGVDNGQITISQFARHDRKRNGDTSYAPKPASKVSQGRRTDSSPRRVADSFASFARRSWLPSAKIPRSSKDQNAGRPGDDLNVAEQERDPKSSDPSGGLRSRSRLRETGGDRPQKPDVQPTAPGDVSPKRQQKRSMGSVFGNSAPDIQGKASTSSLSLPKSFSTDKLVNVGQPLFSATPSSFRNVSAEKLHGIGIYNARKKDELWTLFRGLESDFLKFQSKNSALKPNVIRSSLLPFLQGYAHHPSNKNLTPEDLDRRTSILNKWWTGILEVLQSGNNQMIAATDTPVMLDALAGLMTREEWRLPPSSFAPLAERLKNSSLRSRSTTSLESSSSDYLAESVHHSVRNTFIHNLMAQTAFVISRMSLRRAQASVVAWSGKALAYAFYFCPGVADMLVHLWSPPGNTIKQVLREYGIDFFKSTKTSAESIVSGFPTFLHALGYTSFATTVRRFRKPVSSPPGLMNINWSDSTWTARWLGEQSDLFFVFVKHWHILLEDFLPKHSELKDKIHSPGFVMVHAHVLRILESTIQRQSTTSQAIAAINNAPVTFEDVLAGEDNSADALALPPTNVTRMMAENRLIMLLRDVLSETSTSGTARETFAETFASLLQAVARRVFMFDYHACSTLCDFLEEAVYIVTRYHSAYPAGNDVNWAFWLNVCKQMADSPSTLSEMRLFAFLYSIWNIIVEDPHRKECLCVDWLLSDAIFEKFFFHWCPIIRAYYMRLLCWRVARADGGPSTADETVVRTLNDRLESAWSRFVYLHDKARSAQLVPPSTAPSTPAPGRQLLIIRNEVQVPSSLYLSLDGIVPPSQSQIRDPADGQPPSISERTSPFRRKGSRPSIGPSQSKASSSSAEGGGRRSWSLFQNVKSFATSHTKESASDVDGDDITEHIRKKPTKEARIHDEDTAALAKSPSDATQAEGNSDHGPVNSKAHEQYSFRFSLEWTGNQHGMPGESRLSPPKLPSHSKAMWPAKRGDWSHANGPPPVRRDRKSDKYVGRALAEWDWVVNECHRFFIRRRQAGAASDAHVEIPTLGVENFRRG